MKYHLYGPALFLTTLCFGFQASAEDNLQDALRNGKWLADMQIRHEFVDQDGFDKPANASTMRMRGGYHTGSFHGLSLLAEGEFITHIGAPRFDDGVDGRIAYPSVGDPDDAALNRLFLQYDGIRDTRFTLGRFKLAFDNQRFVGQGDARQNDMTYDGMLATNESVHGLRLDYAYINQANRPSGTHSDTGKFEGDIHLMHAKYQFTPDTGLSAYGYLLGLEDYATRLASQTYGLRLDGRYPLSPEMALLYTLEGAMQSDYDNNPDNYDAYYYHVASGLSYGVATYRLGYEMLGGDGTHHFRTPISGAHNGAVEMFTGAAIPEGLRDIYGSVEFAPAMLKDTLILLAAHDFASDTGGIHYGFEWDAAIEKRLSPRWVIGAECAEYHAREFGADTAQAMVYARFTY